MTNHLQNNGAGPPPTLVLEGMPSFIEARCLKRALLAEHRASWEMGNPVQPEAVLVRWPSDPQNDSDVASLLYQDYHQRQLKGENPTLGEYQRRFPEHGEALAKLLSQKAVSHILNRENGNGRAPLSLPQVGDGVFGFRLCHEIGRGAFARVFLGEQIHLASRPVVLKISAVEGEEPKTLAQLQHTHIVPIFSVHDDIRAGIRAVCMPYFAGASLDRVLQVLWAETKLPRHGGQLVDALQKIPAPLSPSPRGGEGWGDGAVATPNPPPRPPNLRFSPKESEGNTQSPLLQLRRFSYFQAAAWIVARLAEALQHAHHRGVIHRDIKPSNILLAGDGQPLLLDFNLARDLHENPTTITLGGTVAYMAPEHLRAVWSRNPEQIRQVDNRSDIYALGMVLYEILTGHRPFEQSGSYSVLPKVIEAMAAERSQSCPSLRKKRADVPWGLESIARQALAPEPGQRYQHAEHLAEDLRCFLEDRSLKYAPELSRTEQFQKWLRRHPRLTSSGSVAAAAALVLIAVGAAFAVIRGHLAQAKDQLQAAQSRERKEVFEQGTIRTLCLVNTVADLQDHLRQGLAVCENTLALYDILDDDNWQESPAWKRLAAEERQKLAENARELLLLLAWARSRLAPEDPAVLRQALTLLDRAEAIEHLNPSRVLWIDRARYLGQLGEIAQAKTARSRAEQIQPTSAQDHYLLAITYVRQGRPDDSTKALAELDLAIAQNPRHYWAWVQRGLCHQEQGEYLLAAGDFGACLGLWPEFAWGYFNRGFVHGQSGNKEEAIKDYTAALDRDPSLVIAYLNRGLAYLELKKYGPALADFDQVHRLGQDDASLHAGRGMALEGLQRCQEADSAFRTALARAAGVSASARNRIRCAYGFAVASRLPEQAQKAFDEALQEDPRCAQALYGRGLLADKQTRAQEALQFFNKAVEADPNFIEARRFRAILDARRGELNRASLDINWCLEKEPRAGITLYAAACVAAHAAEQIPLVQTTNQALDLLEKALHQGYGLDQAAEDPDLAGIRHHPKFNQKIAQAKGKFQAGKQ